MSFMHHDRKSRVDAAKNHIAELQRKLSTNSLGSTDEERTNNIFSYFHANADVMRKYLDKFITVDPDMLTLKSRIPKIYPSFDPVLITGPTGTGKELLAKAFTKPSKLGADGLPIASPFIAENCAGIPDTLAESLFFGHRKGSFTGAIDDHIGLLESAGTGICFLDEIGDLSPSIQAKLLRALQEHEIRRVGETRVRDINCRFIAATKYNLEDRVSQGLFREDLFARLMTFPLAITGLQARPCDIKAITVSMLARPDDIDTLPPFSERALAYIHKYNVRAIESLLEQWRRTQSFWL